MKATVLVGVGLSLSLLVWSGCRPDHVDALREPDVQLSPPHHRLPPEWLSRQVLLCDEGEKRSRGPAAQVWSAAWRPENSCDMAVAARLCGATLSSAGDGEAGTTGFILHAAGGEWVAVTSSVPSDGSDISEVLFTRTRPDVADVLPVTDVSDLVFGRLAGELRLGSAITGWRGTLGLRLVGTDTLEVEERLPLDFDGRDLVLTHEPDSAQVSWWKGARCVLKSGRIVEIFLWRSANIANL